MIRLTLKLIGPFLAMRDDEVLSGFPTSKVQALLIYLAVEQALTPGVRPRREYVMTLLWPEVPAASARQNLRQSLYLLRQEIPAVVSKAGAPVPLIHSDRQTVHQHPDAFIDLDVASFVAGIANSSTRALENAIALYRGDFLADFYLPDSNEFESWAANRRAMLRETALEVLAQLAMRYLEEGRLRQAEQAARRQLEIEPLGEGSRRQLMQALAMQGRRSAALAEFERLRQLLHEELAAEPGPATLTLHERILSGELAPQAQASPATLALPLDSVPEPAPLPPWSVMPLNSNPLFVGREGDLLAVARTFHSPGTVSVYQVETAATTGLGGIGKTQLACEFVHRYGRYFPGGVYWLSFDNPPAIAAEVAACGRADALALSPDFDRLTLREQVRLVQSAWRQPVPRLLVFDNCEDPALLAEWRPTSGGCRVLVTSRRGEWEPVLGVQTLALGVLSRAESLSLLEKHLPTLDVALGDGIAAELGDLPLALHLAGSYLRRYRRVISPADYLAQLQDPLLLHHPSMRGRGFSPTGHGQHVGRAFALSHDRLDPSDEIDDLALKLLVRAAHFAPGEPIWYRLLVRTLHLGVLPALTLKVENAVARLVELGLIEMTRADSPTGPVEAMRMHRLVAAFVRDMAHESVVATQQAVEAVVLEEMAASNQSGYPRPLLTWQLHLRSVADSAMTRADAEAAGLCAELARHLLRIGDFDGALPYAARALAVRETLLGRAHPEVAASLNLLGEIQLALGNQLEEAREHFESALSMLQERPMPGDIAGARTLNLLGRWHLNHGSAQRSLAYFAEALAVCQALYGEEHPLTAEYENNLGDARRSLGELEAALPHLERALAINERLYGPRHPNTAMNLNNIAIVLHDLGRPAEARPYYERSLTIRQAAMGNDHPETALMLNNLGSLLLDLGEQTEAEAALQEALRVFERALPEFHGYTAFALNNLGKLYRLQGDLPRARACYERALQIREAVITEDHPLKALSLQNLGELLTEQGRTTEAAGYLERALAGYQRTLGADHATTQAVSERLAALSLVAADLPGGAVDD